MNNTEINPAVGCALERRVRRSPLTSAGEITMKANKFFVAWSMVVMGGLLISLGAANQWGTTGALVVGGIYMAICGATQFTD